MPFGLSLSFPQGFLDVYDVKSENNAEAWTRTGVAAVAVVGALSARDAGRRFQARPLSISIVFTIALATWFDITGSLVQRMRLVI